jgi:D-aminoacyl-tRNA deacylase
MRALLQRVERASVEVDGQPIAAIGPGLLVLLGVAREDDDRTVDQLAARVATLRIFRDAEGRTNRSVVEVGGSALVVSQFTLYADISRGRRPGFTDAGPPALAELLYRRFADGLRAAALAEVGMGRFGAEMRVELVNDGPFTIWLDSADRPQVNRRRVPPNNPPRAPAERYLEERSGSGR